MCLQKTKTKIESRMTGTQNRLLVGSLGKFMSERIEDERGDGGNEGLGQGRDGEG